MNLLLGLVVWLVFFIFMGLSFYLGYKQGLKTKKPLLRADEKEKLKRELMKQGMQNILNYDYSKALGVKHE